MTLVYCYNCYGVLCCYATFTTSRHTAAWRRGRCGNDCGATFMHFYNAILISRIWEITYQDIAYFKSLVRMESFLIKHIVWSILRSIKSFTVVSRCWVPCNIGNLLLCKQITRYMPCSTLMYANTEFNMYQL